MLEVLTGVPLVVLVVRARHRGWFRPHPDARRAHERDRLALLVPPGPGAEVAQEAMAAPR